MEILAVLLSTLATVFICITPLIKGKNMKMILLLLFLTNVFLAVSYALTGAYNGAASCGVGAVLTVINFFFERKNKPLPRWLIALYALAFTGVNLAVFSHITDILAILAALAFIMEICQKNGKAYRVWMFTNTGLWIAYDLINRSYGPLTTHAILLASIILGIVMHDKKKK